MDLFEHAICGARTRERRPGVATTTSDVTTSNEDCEAHPMGTKFLTAAIPVIALIATVSAQSQVSAPNGGKDAKSAPVVLTGCVASPAPGTITVEDEKKGRFQLTGRKLDLYIGKRVEVRGGGGGLHITTGLYPSPNVAAQAGAIDPVQAARAAMPGSPDYNATNAPLPKLSVNQIKTLPGSCTPPSK